MLGEHYSPMSLGKGSQLQPVVEQLSFPHHSFLPQIHTLRLLTHEVLTTLPSVKAVNQLVLLLSPTIIVPEPRNTESPPSRAALEANTLFHCSHWKDEGIFECHGQRTAYSIE